MHKNKYFYLNKAKLLYDLRKETKKKPETNVTTDTKGKPEKRTEKPNGTESSADFVKESTQKINC